MRRSFGHLPINQKLRLVTILWSIAGMLLAFAFFIQYDQLTLKRDLVRDMGALAEILSENSRQALVSDHPEEAKRLLDGLKRHPKILLACLYDSEGRAFAWYVRGDVDPRRILAPSIEEGHRFQSGELQLRQSLSFDGATIGSIRIEVELSDLKHRMRLYGGAFMLLFALSIAGAHLIGWLFQRTLTRPLLNLAHAARIVSANKNFSIRAIKQSDDEVGFLTESFNRMLAEIEARDRALQRSEERFRALIENASDIIAIVDLEGNVQYVSPSVTRRLGYSPEEARRTNILEIIHPDDRNSVVRVFRRLLIQDVTHRVECRIQHADGSWLCVEALGKSLVDEPGVKGIVINARDITERKRNEEELRAYAAKLEQSNRELQDFAYVASHDLQEPLRKILAFGDRLRVKCGDQLSEQGADYLERMQNAAARMQTLISDLLTFSRVTTKAKPFEPVALTEVVHEVISDLETRLEETEGRVEVGDLPTIDADALQMRQLFQNLLSNALKFHREDEPPLVKIQGALIEDASGEPRCQVSVTDNGIGFDEKYRDRIFGIFQRLHGRGTYEGTGVGLAICRKIVKRHGGTITAHSHPGQGATFVVTLPVHQPKGEESP